MKAVVSAALLTLSACGPEQAEPVEPQGGETLGTTSNFLKASENAVPGQYIVVLKEPAPGVAAEKVPDVARGLASRYAGSVGRTFEHALRGFTVNMSEAQARALAKDPAVKYVEEDALAHAIEASTQTSPPWGLDRVDQRNLPLNAAYTYTSSGSSVHAYILDTGIRATHTEFSGNATADFTSIYDGNGANDCHGHGTHVAATIGGSTYGVAKSISLHGVRVINCSGNGTTSEAIAGVDWVTANHIKPAVANMSLQYPATQALDDSIRASIRAGVTYVVAANNFNQDACLRSPSRVAEAITVGATDSADQRASFSSWGTCVDLFAPGVDVLSAYYTADDATTFMSGTSMATPHVAGAVARYLRVVPGATPAQVQDMINTNASVNKVGNPGTGSPNRLLYTGFVGETFSNGSVYAGLGQDTYGDVQYQAINVPAGQARLDFFMSGGTGDADMYVQFGSLPTLSTWSCRPYVGGNQETCTFFNPPAGTWYVMVRAYSPYSGVSVAGVWSNPLQNGMSVTGVSANIFERRYYTLDMPAGYTNVRFDTWGGTGDVDVRGRSGSVPGFGAECTSSASGNTESCFKGGATPGTWFVELRPKFNFFNSSTWSFSNVSLIGWYY
ncbi:S8 family peptidase [Archangium sp.]|uniref:S8 family peptidase n=1 Tax=Archangium sp. TaxID=1872627 RepID=UPI002E31EF7B|nr:S8 family peptidase [Archangium sp.]